MEIAVAITAKSAAHANITRYVTTVYYGICYRREISLLCAEKSEMQGLAEKMKTKNAMLTQK